MPRWFPERESDTPYFCVTGSPVTHSKSPQIHSAFAAQTGRAVTYDRIEVLPGQLALAVAEFQRAGGHGMNVTVPLKEEAYALAARKMERAEAAGAANTLWFEADGTVAADNTDGTGLVYDLAVNQGVELAGQRILLVGAGGAARGVLPALVAARPARIVITNRTESKATAIAARFAAQAALDVLSWGAATTQPFDIIVNATSLSLRGQLPPLPQKAVHADSVCYDMMYGSEAGVFTTWAMQAGVARASDGLGMLVEQAAEAFEIWHGVRPETGPVITQLRASFNQGPATDR